MSASSYVTQKYGGLNDQLRQFDSQSGSTIKPLGGGGRRRRKTRRPKSKKRKSQKGGFWGQIINQAIVPFSILGMQQSYKRKPSYKGKHRSFRRR
jgi:hypothetical protein